MSKKNIVKNIGDVVINLGSKTVEKSPTFGMYDPEIPEILKKKTNLKQGNSNGGKMK